MALPDLTGQNIQDTYPRVLQTDGIVIYNGTGSIFLPVSASYSTTSSFAEYAISASHEIIKEISSSYAETSSYAINFKIDNNLETTNITASGYFAPSGSIVNFASASVYFPVSVNYARMRMGDDVLNGGANAQDFTSATAVKTQFNTQEDLTGDGLTIDTSNNRITVSGDGHYRLTANISFYSTQQRITPTTFFRVNGTTDLIGESYGYIRAANGQNENSNNVTRVIELSAGDYIEVMHFDASTLTGPCYATQAIFEVEQLSGAGPKGETGNTGAQGIQGPSGTSYDVVEITSNTTLSNAHTTKYLVCNSATAIDITVPQTASYDQYAEFVFEQRGAGVVRIVADTGVTVNSSETLSSAGQYTVMGLKRTDTNVYTLTGEREATP